MEFFATLTSSASLTAYKPPGATADESIRVGRGGADPRVADADLAGSGEISDRIEGRASTKDAGELRAASVLVEHLNAQGGRWAPPSLQTGPEDGVDAIASDGVERLRIQVTTPERSAWAQLATEPQVARSDESVDVAVEAIRTAIESKTLFAGRDDIVLALDATDSPVYALSGVAEAFRAGHEDWARQVGYKAIWLVGPIVDLVHRLDNAEG
jgi:hypothetical protein